MVQADERGPKKDILRFLFQARGSDENGNSDAQWEKEQRRGNEQYVRSQAVR